jgi:hypothetical protein
MERSRPTKGIDQARLAPTPSKCKGADAAAMLSSETDKALMREARRRF